MKTKLLTIIILLLTLGINAQIQIRDTIYSKILEENRPYSISLPNSYSQTVNRRYPVLYILDGDYNFNYVQGLLELQSSISEQIPEIILIAISGKGTKTYRKNCKPAIKEINDSGNAHQMALFIEEELIPEINNKYKTTNFRILAGHSVGGLFVINTAINKPELFKEYIAISPALWWENNAINQIAKDKIDKGFNTSVYISLADEKGMGVDSFLSIATSSILKNPFTIFGIAILSIILAIYTYFKRKNVRYPFFIFFIGLGITAFLRYGYYPSNNHFKFKNFSKENHNSVGVPTYQWALNSIFKEWKITKQYFENTNDVLSHYKQTENRFGSNLNLPLGIIANTVYILQDKPNELDSIQIILLQKDIEAAIDLNSYRASKLIDEKQIEKAEQLLNNAYKLKSNSFEILHQLARLRFLQKDTIYADSLITQSIILAKKQQVPQWQQNELLETQEQFKK